MHVQYYMHVKLTDVKYIQRKYIKKELKEVKRKRSNLRMFTNTLKVQQYRVTSRNYLLFGNEIKPHPIEKFIFL